MHTVTIQDAPNGCRKKVTVDGVEYPSMFEMRCSLCLGEMEILNYKKHMNVSTEQAISDLLDKQDEYIEKLRKKAKEEKRAAEEKRLKEKEKEFSFRGKTYRTFGHCCRYYRDKFGIWISNNSIRATARRNQEPLQDALERAIKRLLKKRYKDEISCAKEGIIVVNSREKLVYYKEKLGDRYIWTTQECKDKRDYKTPGMYGAHGMLYRIGYETVKKSKKTQRR